VPRKPGSIPVFLPEVFAFDWVHDPHDGPRAWSEAWGFIRYEDHEDEKNGEHWTVVKDYAESVIRLVRIYPQAFDAPNIVRTRNEWKVRNTPRTKALLKKLLNAYLKGSQHQGRGNALSRLSTACRTARLFAKIAETAPRPVPRQPPDLGGIASSFGVTRPNAHRYWVEIFDACVGFRRERTASRLEAKYHGLKPDNPFSDRPEEQRGLPYVRPTDLIAPKIAHARHDPQSLDYDRDVLPYVLWLEYVFARCLSKLVDYFGGPD